MAPLETGWLPGTPIDDSVLRSFLYNQMDLNALMASATGGEVVTSDDVHLASTTTPVPEPGRTYRPVLSLDDPVLDAAEEFFARVEYPATLFSIWPAPDLTARGWRLWGHPMFCVLGPTTPASEQPDDVEIRLARNAEDLEVAERIAIAGSMYPPTLLDTDLEVRIGRLEGATASRYEGHGVSNLAIGATLPQARRRGVWRSLVWERIRSAPQLPAVTFTSDDSRPGFVAMGFLPVLRLTLWGRG
jgi:hypothetical protein